MKHMNRILALALALIMVLGLATTASAAAMEGTQTGGSITVLEPENGATYKAYQIMYLEHFDAEKETIIYKVNSDWEAWLRSQTEYVAVDEDGYVSWVEGADAADFAEAAKGELSTKSPAGSVTAEDGEAVISDLTLGYYLVDTNLGSLCSLDTTTPNASVKEKNEVPAIDKQVKEDSTNEWGKLNDADINQTVEFKATITVQKGAENYIVHDQMSEAFDFLGVTSVELKAGGVVSADNYTVTPNAVHNEGKHAGKTCTFDLAFDNDYIASLAPGTEIYVLYAGKLNEKANVKTGIPNSIDMQFGDLNDPEWTPTSVTKTYTWDMSIIKEDGKSKEKLAGAEFKLTTDKEGKNALKFHALENNQYEVCAMEAGTEEGKCSKTHVTSFTTDDSGNIYIKGIDAATYHLHEVNPPAGYNKLDGSIEVVITAEENDDATELSYQTVNKTIENNTGVELPDTGGVGTTIFYIVGGLLAVAAVVLLVTKKRMASAE